MSRRVAAAPRPARVSKAAASAAAATLRAALGMRQPSAAELAGLVEQPAAPGSSYTVLVPVNGAVPTLEQRVLMAKHAQRHTAAGRYVRTVRLEEQGTQDNAVQPQPEGAPTMKTKTAGLPAGVNPAEIQRAFNASNKEVAEREAQAAKDAAKKAKADEAKRKAEAAARKRAKAKGVTPKPSAKPETVSTKVTPSAAPDKGGRPAKTEDPNARYVVAKDNTRSGHMKTFMAGAAQLKKFTRAELVNATKSKVTADRAERYFDYCLYKRLIKPA